MMNPKVKLLLLISISIIMLLFPNPIVVIAVAAISVFIIFAKGRGLSMKFVAWLKPLMLVFLLIVILNSFTYSGFTFSIPGLSFGIIFAMRVFALVGMVFLFTQTTSMSRLAEAFDWLPGQFSFVFVLTLALVPKVTRLTGMIVNAQKSRGLNFRSLNIIRTYFPILVPLFAKTLGQSRYMALAMEARGFESE
jgi:cobalt/nickel transport system permease protein/energy-coupling factor transport system permease protein